MNRRYSCRSAPTGSIRTARRAVSQVAPAATALSSICDGDEDDRIERAPTLAETGVVLTARRGKPALRLLEDLVRELDVTVTPFGEPEWKAAVTAFQRFGRGCHKAALDFGDCLAYAAAAVVDDTLLFVGDDFARTDIRPALRRR